MYRTDLSPYYWSYCAYLETYMPICKNTQSSSNVSDILVTILYLTDLSSYYWSYCAYLERYMPICKNTQTLSNVSDILRVILLFETYMPLKYSHIFKLHRIYLTDLSSYYGSPILKNTMFKHTRFLST